MVLSMADRLIETGRCCGMGTNAETSKVMRLLREPSPVLNEIDQKKLGNVNIPVIWVA